MSSNTMSRIFKNWIMKVGLFFAGPSPIMPREWSSLKRGIKKKQRDLPKQIRLSSKGYEPSKSGHGCWPARKITTLRHENNGGKGELSKLSRNLVVEMETSIL